MLKVNQLQNGLLDGDNSSRTDKYDINASYYPGVDLPSISLSFGRHLRDSGDANLTWEDFLIDCGAVNNDIPDSNDCYTSWEFLDTDDDDFITEDEFILVDSRINTQTDNYNFGYNQRFFYKYKQNISFNYYHSTKKDLLLEEITDVSYISPRSLNKSLGINLATFYNKNFDSKVHFSSTNYNFGQNTSDFYLDQKIKQIGLGFNYRTNNFIEKVGAEVSYTTATGTNIYNQVGIKVFSKFVLLEDILLNISYRYNNKTQSSVKYYNNIFRVNLSYKF